MSKEQVRIRQSLYWNRRGSLENKETISEFSYKQGQFLLDRSNARYLVEDNIKEEVSFDLTVGCREHYEEIDEEDDSNDGEEEKKEDSDDVIGEEDLYLSTFCEWACTQPQQSLKEVFGGADFVSYRVSFRDIAKSLMEHHPFRDAGETRVMQQSSSLKDFINAPLMRRPNKPWAQIAMKAGDVILFRSDTTSPFIDDSDDEYYDDEEVEEIEEEPEECDGDKNEKEELAKRELYLMRINEMRRDALRQQIFSGFKFEQYMTSDEPEGEAHPENKLDRKVIQTIMTADLIEEGFETIRVCSFADVDAFRGDEPIELKSTFKESFFSKMHTLFHCNFANMKSYVTGFRNEDWITTRVIERRLDDLQNDMQSRTPDESRPYEKGYAFLYDVLSMTKHILTRAKACRFVYLPKSGIIQFEPLTVAEANMRGFGFTKEFKERFQID